jgi:hypothetical protein
VAAAVAAGFDAAVGDENAENGLELGAADAAFAPAVGLGIVGGGPIFNSAPGVYGIRKLGVEG